MESVAQLVPQHRALGVAGQLEQVEAGGGGGQAAARLATPQVEEPLQHRAHRVPSVLTHTVEEIGACILLHARKIKTRTLGR